VRIAVPGELEFDIVGSDLENLKRSIRSWCKLGLVLNIEHDLPREDYSCRRDGIFPWDDSHN
jgi:hypothetical protein